MLSPVYVFPYKIAQFHRIYLCIPIAICVFSVMLCVFNQTPVCVLRLYGWDCEKRTLKCSIYVRMARDTGELQKYYTRYGVCNVCIGFSVLRSRSPFVSFEEKKILFRLQGCLKWEIFLNSIETGDTPAL